MVANEIYPTTRKLENTKNAKSAIIYLSISYTCVNMYYILNFQWGYS